MARKRPRGSAITPRIASGYVGDSLYTADDLFLQPLPSLQINNSFVRSPLSEFEDNRHWNPDPSPASRNLRGGTSPTKLAPRSKAARSSRGLLFDMQALTFRGPKFVVRCIRRKMRDEVLHALGKTGKGSGRKLKNRKYNRNQQSNIRC